MNAAGKAQPIIVFKKKGGHGGHHGGAWKVAYADFVTAMMSLFIVLWLMNSSENVKKAVAGYFNDPKGTSNQMGTTMSGTGEAVTASAMTSMEQLKERIEAGIKAKADLDKLSKQIEITITAEGLRIELLEDKNGTFYEMGSARLSGSGQELLSLIAGELKTLPNALLIEGHTDAAQYSNDAGYTNWELSADRANAARRLLQQDGVGSRQVTQVRGYADQLLRVKANPYDPSNRRISILVKNDALAAPPAIASPGAKQGETGPADHAGETSKSTKAKQPASAPKTGDTKADAASKPGLIGRLKGFLPGHGK